MIRTEAITASGPCHNRKTYVPRSPYRSGLSRFSVHLLLKPQKAEQLVQAANPKLQHAAGDRAYYRPSTDSIHLPLKEQFSSAGDYYSTLLHELGHNADSRIMPRRMLGTHQSLGNPTRLLGII
jgi:hypothetical protein